jgi:NTE family protein
MHVGLVLGAGGVVGASWLIGALEARESETGFSPGMADVVVGTSAGSVVGALVAAGLPPALLAAYSAGDPLELEGFTDVQGTLAEIAR